MLLPFIIHQIFLLASNSIDFASTKTAEYPSDIFQLKNSPCCKKYWKDNKHNSRLQFPFDLLIFRYLSFDITCCSKPTVILKLHSWKTFHFSEQIMFADKYLRVFCTKWRLLLFLFTTQAHGISFHFFERLHKLMSFSFFSCNWHFT